MSSQNNRHARRIPAVSENELRRAARERQSFNRAIMAAFAALPTRAGFNDRMRKAVNALPTRAELNEMITAACRRAAGR
jgi:hypothetical protein